MTGVVTNTESDKSETSSSYNWLAKLMRDRRLTSAGATDSLRQTKTNKESSGRVTKIINGKIENVENRSFS